MKSTPMNVNGVNATGNQSAKFCTQCGCKFLHNHKYCGGCGHKRDSEVIVWLILLFAKQIYKKYINKKGVAEEI